MSFEATGGGGVQSENFQTLFFPRNAIGVVLKFLSNVIPSMQRHKRNVKFTISFYLVLTGSARGDSFPHLLLQTRQAQTK